MRRSVATALSALIFVLHLVAPAGESMAQEAFYYKDGEKVPLEVIPTKKYVLLEPQASREILANSLKSGNEVVMQFSETKPLTSVNLREGQQLPRYKWAIVDNVSLEASQLDQGEIKEQVLYEAPFFVTSGGEEVGHGGLPDQVGT